MVIVELTKKNAGTYEDKLTASGFDLNNYTVDYDYGDMKINKADLTFYVGNKDKTYGELNPGFSGGSGEGWVNNESLTNVNNNGTYSNPAISMEYSTDATQQSDVGNYDIDVSSDTKTSINATTIDDNYNITYESGNLEITKADLNFNATGSSEYGTVPDIDDLTLKAVKVAADEEASKTNDGSLKSWDSGSKDNIKTLTGFDSTDSITLYTTIDGTTTEIGTVTSVVRDTDGTVLSYALADGSFKDANGNMQLSTKNYNLNFDGTGSTFEVTPKELQFAIDSAKKTYGEDNPTFEGDDGIGWVNGDSLDSINNNGEDEDINLTIDYGSTANEKSNVGKYDITITNQETISDTLSNYAVTYGTNELTVGKAQLDFVVGDQSKTYGDENDPLTGQFDSSDFKNGDSITVDATTGAVTNVSLNDNGTSTDTDINSSQVSGFKYESDATQYSDANGDYYIKADGFDLTNYKVNYTDGDLDIGKAQLTYTVNDLAKEYGEDPTYTGTYTGLKGDNDANTLGSIDPSITGADQQSDVGEYDLTATFDEDVISDDFRNYELTTESGKLTVTPADLYFNAEGERDYGVDSSVDDFTYSASKDVSDTKDGALKSWDSSSEDDLATLEGFNKNGTDDLILYTEVDGERTQIGTVTNVQFDSNNNVIGYTLADGSFTRADGSNQLGSLNYNWIFDGGSYTINTLPIPEEPGYQEGVSIVSSLGGFREPNDIASILYLNVVDNAINVNLGELERFDDFKNLVNVENSESFDDLEISK
jgi:hypothetical protein